MCRDAAAAARSLFSTNNKLQKNKTFIGTGDAKMAETRRDERMRERVRNERGKTNIEPGQ